MTAPTALSQDAINLGVTKSAQMVTEYMPSAECRIINSGTDTVYLGTHSGVGNTTGVPVEAGASVTWNNSGELWAVLDSAATSTKAVIIVTSLITDWNESPTRVATATALALLAGGVPNVLTQTVIGQYTLAASGGQVSIPVAQYASLLVAPYTSSSYPNALWKFSYQFQTADASQSIIRQDTYGSVAGLPGGVTLRVDGPVLVIVNQSASPIQFNLIGSNRPQDAAARSSNTTSEGEHAQVAVPAGGTYPLTFLGQYNGPCFVRFAITGTTNQGGFQLTTTSGEIVTLMDFGEMITSGANKVVTKLIAFPVSGYAVKYICTTFAAAHTALMDVIPWAP